jgi:glycosyltransferase involved in cell wall biosynthesis/GT2 family glycosyltransferase
VNLDVVVVTFGSAKHLDNCLSALPREVNVTVVDNASDDSSPEIARLYGATVIENADNRGFGAAANQGAKHGSAPYILFLNPDATVAPGCVEALVAELAADVTVASAGPRLITPDGRRQRPWWPLPSASRSWQEALGLHRLVRADLDEPRDVPFIVGACLLVRRDAFEAVGGFDEAFWLYGEEGDLAQRLAGEGWRARYVPSATCVHVGGASGGESDLAFEHFQRGTERFILKHNGRAALLSHRLALLFGSLARLLILVLGGRGRTSTARTRARIGRRLANVLLRSPLSVPGAPRASSGPPDHDLVVLSLEPWDDVWRRNQFLVRELLALDPDRRVLFVEPPIDVPHHLFTTRKWPPRAGLRASASNERMLLYRPLKLVPRVLGPAADRLLLRSLRRAIESAGLTGPTLWVNDPAYAAVTRWGAPVVYDLTDDWTRSNATARTRRRLKAWDDELSAGSQQVVACSEDLRNSHAPREVHVIPNAVDAEHFATPTARPSDLPASPTAVYVGTLHEDRLDVGLVEDVARALPELNVALVGPNSLSADSTRRLSTLPNVHVLGARPYAVIPGYLQHAEVIVVPHVVSPFTESLDPIKAYECQVVGRPTVSTEVAGFRDLEWPIVSVARDEFAIAVDNALHWKADGHQEPQVPSWHERAKDFARVLDTARQKVEQQRLFVVYIDHCAELSGGELALARLLEALDVRAHVILGEDGPLVVKLQALGATVEVLRMPGAAHSLRRGRVRLRSLPIGAIVQSAGYTLRLSRRLRQLAPDLVHTNSLKAAFYGSIAARLARRPVLVHARDRISPDYLPSAAVHLVRLLLRVVPTAVIANSQATLETLRLPGGHAAVVPSPVVYDATPVFSQVQRRDDPRFTVVMLGRIASWKGQDVFLEAFARTFPDGEQRALIVGSAMFGEEAFEQQLRVQCGSLGLTDRVRFDGFREDISAVLRQADVLVHASVIPEPFGQVVLEGMAAGVPVVASSAGGPAEVITDGENGLLVPPGDVAALGQALRRLEADPNLRERLAEAGRRRAKDFDPAVVADQIAQAYAAMCKEAAR